MDHWPLFGLSVITPRLTLVYPSDEQIDRLGALAATGIHDPDSMPFNVPWSRREPPWLQRGTLQYHWRLRAEWAPEAWEMPMVTLVEGEVVGTQGVSARNFAVARTVETGSWLGRAFQGRGIGREMRAAILHLAFAGLGARVAYTSAFRDNAPSLGVTRSLGYMSNGSRVVEREGRPTEQLHFRLERGAWEGARRSDIRIEGLEPCLDLFGLPVTEAEGPSTSPLE